MIVLAYLGPLALIPLFATEDEDLRWHGRQGLVLMGAEIAVWLLGAFFFSLVAMFDFGCGGCIFHVLFVIFILILHIACMVQGLNGKRLRVPGVANLADRF